MQKNKENYQNALKEVISNDNIDEKFIRDFLTCNVIGKNSEILDIDKIMFIYKYGSKKAKKIAVDERLKFN